jgi:CheY-like chemotaxis protein
LDILKNFRPELLILDFAMPGINGAEIAAAAREANRSLKILFVSGFADTDALEEAAGEIALLHKPFRPAELAAAVRKALDVGS